MCNKAQRLILLLGMLGHALCSGVILTLQYEANDSVVMYSDNSVAPWFIPPPFNFNCGNSFIFTVNQTKKAYEQKSPSYLLFTNLTQAVSLSISTRYNYFSPYLNASSCLGTIENPSCALEIYNNCSNNYFHFFDTFELTVAFSSPPSTSKLYYNFICDDTQISNAFEAGLIVLIAYASIIIGVATRYSLAHSWNNRYYAIGFPSIVVFVLALSTGVFFIISNISNSTLAISDLLLVLSTLYGAFSTMVCFTEILYKRHKYLNLEVRLKKLKLKLLDILGLLLGAGLEAAWWFSNRNWILSDVLFTFMLVTTIKLFKFRSLFMAVVCFSLVTVVFVAFIVICQVFYDTSFNNIILTIFDNPVFCVCPTITPVPNQKCSWLSLFSLSYPALVLAYLESFDESRKTRVYSIVFLGGFILLSMIWSLLNVAVPFTLPFDLITSPLTLIVVCLYANRRNELPTLWSGEFSRDSDHSVNFELQNTVSVERSASKVTLRPTLFGGLRAQSDMSDMSVLRPSAI